MPWCCAKVVSRESRTKKRVSVFLFMSVLNSMSTQRSGSGATQLNGKVYAAGGKSI